MRSRARLARRWERRRGMSKLRTSAIAAATLLVLVHVGVLTLRYGSDMASLWGDWIDVIAPLIAAVICWRTALLAGPFGKRLWRLTSLSALVVAASQALYTDY